MPQSQPHMMPGPPDACGGAGGNGEGLQQDLLMQQLQQIHQIVANSDLGLNKNAPGGTSASTSGALGGNPESSNNTAQQPSNATPQNILAALADFQKQQPTGAGGNFVQENDGGYGGGANKHKGVDGTPGDGSSGQPPQSNAHGQQILQQ